MMVVQCAFSYSFPSISYLANISSELLTFSAYQIRATVLTASANFEVNLAAILKYQMKKEEKKKQT